MNNTMSHGIRLPQRIIPWPVAISQMARDRLLQMHIEADERLGEIETHVRSTEKRARLQRWHTPASAAQPPPGTTQIIPTSMLASFGYLYRG